MATPRRYTVIGKHNGFLRSVRVPGPGGEGEGDEESGESGVQVLQDGAKKLRLLVRGVIGAALFLVVLALVTFSKLSLIRLANELRHLTVNKTPEEVSYWKT